MDVEGLRVLAARIKRIENSKVGRRNKMQEEIQKVLE